MICIKYIYKKKFDQRKRGENSIYISIIKEKSKIA